MNIQFKNISKSYDSAEGAIDIIRDLDATFDSGSFVALMGKSGSGKTTILNMIAGLVSPSEGSLKVGERNYSSMNSDELITFRGSHIGIVFQQFNLLADLTVSENIDLVIDINKIPRRRDTQAILEKVGLAGRGDAYPHELSGGEQQRVALARAFVAKTPILLADEPTGNLDEKTAVIIMELLVKLHKETNNTVVMITHDRDIASYADHVYILEDKRLMLVD